MGKHTASKQGRAHGAYRDRLNARGLSKAPTMKDYVGCGNGPSAKRINPSLVGYQRDDENES